MPLADQLPTPGELVADAFDFAGQLLAAQRKLAEEALQVTAPVAGGEAPAAPNTVKAALASDNPPRYGRRRPGP